MPVHIQYGRWIGILPKPDEGFSGLLQGDFGTSLWGGYPIMEEVLKRFPVTLELAVFSVLTSLILALPIGTYSAIRQDTAGDYTGRTIAILAISLPNFWILSSPGYEKDISIAEDSIHSCFEEG